MAKESSVAPKERVNIRYKPATGNAKEEVELPLKLMMLGDYTLRADDTPVEERPLVDVNADNFNDVMRSYDLSLAMAVENKLDDSPDADKLAMSLKFNNLRDFEPEQVVRQVPEMKRMLELREALVALKGPLGNVPAFRKAVQEALDDSAARDRLLGEITTATTSKP
ncbi:MAG: type VI secretion system contractile sheath small subunit [Ancalomicrobiaceae bacterium]|nr:type VI secretion system contractile sheath small subunit [Ancalomicrobiaceae bacterium]